MNTVSPATIGCSAYIIQKNINIYIWPIHTIVCLSTIQYFQFEFQMLEHLNIETGVLCNFKDTRESTDWDNTAQYLLFKYLLLLQLRVGRERINYVSYRTCSLPYQVLVGHNIYTGKVGANNKLFLWLYLRPHQHLK